MILNDIIFLIENMMLGLFAIAYARLCSLIVLSREETKCFLTQRCVLYL